MSDVYRFNLGSMGFEVEVCTDPSSGDSITYVYRIDVPRVLVASGQPDKLTPTPRYIVWEDRLGALEQAVMDCLEGEPA